MKLNMDLTALKAAVAEMHDAPASTEYAIVEIFSENTHSHQVNTHKRDIEFTFNDACLLIGAEKKEITPVDYGSRKSSDLTFVREVQTRICSERSTRIIVASW